MFTQTRSIVWFLNWLFRCQNQDLGLIFLYQRLRRGRHFLRTIIVTQQPPLLSPNLWYLGHIIYSLSLANASVVVVDPVVQEVKYYLPLCCFFCISYCDGFHLWLLGVVSYLTLLETSQLKTVEVKTEYLGYFTRNIQSFGSILSCVVSDIDETKKIYFNLERQW